MVTGESLFCFLGEGRTNKEYQALSIALWKGTGQQEVALFPKDKEIDMLTAVLWYLNNPSHQNVILPFDEHMQGTGRTAGDILWVFWHDRFQTEHKYVQRINGQWAEIPKPDHFVPLWEYENKLKEEKDKIQRQKHELLQIKPEQPKEETVPKEDDSDVTQAEQQEIVEESLVIEEPHIEQFQEDLVEEQHLLDIPEVDDVHPDQMSLF